jgi:hypothetical protein
MMKTNKYWRYILLGAMLLVSYRNKVLADASPIDVPVDEADEYTVVRTLMGTPSWCLEEDPDVRAFILRRFESLATIPTKNLRKGLAHYLAIADGLPGEFQAEERAKGILLNRVLFKVPESVQWSESDLERVTIVKLIQFDHGRVYKHEPWVVATPVVGRLYYLLAPLVSDPDGKLELVSGGEVLAANDYYPSSSIMNEFDFFSERFGRR